MQCPRCQHENPTGSSFCLECGARLGLTCASCGTDLPVGSKFCNKCGTAVGSPAAGQPRFTSPDSYTPKHLAEKILTSKAALEGERKQVTVLFADLKGSMELLADRDPEDARKILDPVLERMIEAVHHYEGTVNQVMGDGIMALFGAPLAHEDYARASLLCRDPDAGRRAALIRLGVALVVEAYARDSQAILARLADMATRGDEPFEIPPSYCLRSSRRSPGDAVEPPALASSSSISPFRRPVNTTAQIGEPSTAEQYTELCGAMWSYVSEC
jgi:double zinc ribbon protein